MLLKWSSIFSTFFFLFIISHYLYPDQQQFNQEIEIQITQPESGSQQYSNSRWTPDSGCMKETSPSYRSSSRAKAPNSSRSERPALCHAAIDRMFSGSCCQQELLTLSHEGSKDCISLTSSPHPSRFKVLVFDFGSVIAKTDRQQVINFIAETLKISEFESNNAYLELKKHTILEKGEQEFWISFAHAKGISLPDDWLEKLDEARLQALHQIPGMISLVKDLQKQGFQTALFSNVRGSQAALKRKLGYYNLFHPVVLSYETGVKKPHPDAYEILLERLQVPPQSILFIDNRQINIESAKKIGIDGIVFTNRDQLLEELKKRGIFTTVNTSTLLEYPQ